MAEQKQRDDGGQAAIYLTVRDLFAAAIVGGMVGVYELPVKDKTIRDVFDLAERMIAEKRRREQATTPAKGGE